MQIQTVKDLGQIFLVNVSKSVPKINGNTDFKEIQEWITLGGVVDSSNLLIQSKTDKIKKLSNNRSILAEITPISYNQKLYSATQNARIAINIFISRMTSLSDPVDYFTSSKEKVQLSKSDFENIRDLIQDRETDLRVQEVDFIASINNCSTVEEVENLNIDFV